LAQRASSGRPTALKRQARQFAALNRAALAIAGDLDLEGVLRRILRTARRLAGASYGALGVPDGKGGFDRFITVGITDRQARRIGELPRFHGVLGVLLRGGHSIRVADIRRHPDFSWYPAHHPILKEFLGVPIKHRGEVLGELYLSGAARGRFTAQDQQVVEMLAAHAGIAIATARLYAQAQELAVLEERNRLARELHDAVSQTLFSMMYEARAGAMKAARDPRGAGAALSQLEQQAAAALSEMRSLVYALRPKSLERDGLAMTLGDHVDAMRRTHGATIDLRIEGIPRLPLDREMALFRIAQEALQNSIKHAAGAPVYVLLRELKGDTELLVKDSGDGFDAARLPATSRTMGLTTMRERADAIGAKLLMTSKAGGGTEVRVVLPANSAHHG
jgi:signal transduction histidine kinase